MTTHKLQQAQHTYYRYVCLEEIKIANHYWMTQEEAAHTYSDLATCLRLSGLFELIREHI